MAPQDDKQPNGNGATAGQVLDQAIAVYRATRRVIGSSASKRIAKLSGLLGTMAVMWLVGNAAGAGGGALDWRGMILRFMNVPTSAALVGTAGPVAPAPERRSVLSADGDVGTDDMLVMLDAVDAELEENHAHDYEQDQKIDGLQQALFEHEKRDLDLREKRMERDQQFIDAFNDLRGEVLKRSRRGSRTGRNGSHATPAIPDQPTTASTGSDG